MSATRRYRGARLVIVVGLVLAGCGGGPSAETEAFCNDYVAVDALMAAGPDEGDPTLWVEEMTTALEGMKTGAPAEVSAAVTRMADALLGPIAELDEAGFFAATESDSYVADAAVVDEYVIAECGFETVEVSGIDYAYDADFESVEAGVVAFDFQNNGTELHEMALIRVNDDATESAGELLEMPEEEAEAKTTFMGVSFAAPGGNDVMYADLEAGRYFVVCFIPTGSTSIEEAESADGPPHFTQGMMKEFTVEG